MTKTTDSRQLGMVFQSILQKHGIWEYIVKDGKDLLVEMDLVTAAKMYFAEFKSKGAVGTREAIFESMKLGAVKALETEAMQSRIYKALGIDPAASPKLWEDVIRFLIREEKDGGTIELFAKACSDDKFNMPKTHQIAMNPNLIIAVWPKIKPQHIAPITPDTDGGYH